MKITVFSDTHTMVSLAAMAVSAEKPDAIIHLGDLEKDGESLHQKYPEIPYYAVRGNCDPFGSRPDRLTVQLGPVKAFLTHGHLYNVKWNGPYSLVYAAMEEGASLALFGHTHEALYETMGGVTVVNPGTAGQGRNLSYAVIEIFDNGGIACEIKDLRKIMDELHE